MYEMLLNFNSIETLILIGLFSIIIEILFVPGLGLLFVGLGSLSTVGIIYFVPNMVDYQYIILAALSAVWFILSWGPLKKYLHKKTNHEKIFDIIGSTVEVVESEIIPGKTGAVTWSGTIMNARLTNNIKKSVPVGSFLKVIEIEGNVLVVTTIEKHEPTQAT